MPLSSATATSAGVGATPEPAIWDNRSHFTKFPQVPIVDMSIQIFSVGSDRNRIHDS